MAQFEYQPMPGRTGVITADGALADVYRRDPTYTEVLTPEQVEAMKGPELDAALQERRLPTGGKVADRRARLRGETPEPVAALDPINVVDPGVLPAEDDAASASADRPTIPVAAVQQDPAVAPDPATIDRDAVGAEPVTTTAAATDRDTTHKEN